MRRLVRYAARVTQAQDGFTLAEVLVATALLSTVLSLVVGGLFQATASDQHWRDDLGATIAWRQGVSIFGRDVVNAQTTDLPDPGPAQSSVTLGWTGTDEMVHTVIYSLSGGSLVRDFDGAVSVAARGIASVFFDLDGSVLTLTLEVNAATTSTDTVVQAFHLPRLP